jgi:hypothetical protein
MNCEGDGASTSSSILPLLLLRSSAIVICYQRWSELLCEWAVAAGVVAVGITTAGAVVIMRGGRCSIPGGALLIITGLCHHHHHCRGLRSKGLWLVQMLEES